MPFVLFVILMVLIQFSLFLYKIFRLIWEPGQLPSVYNELRFYVECTVHKSFVLRGEPTLLDDCFLSKIYCLHRVVCINTNKKIEQKTSTETPDHIQIDFVEIKRQYFYDVLMNSSD